MKKIYDDAKDKNVASVVVYGDTTDNKLYREASGATKTQITEEELQDLFLKRRLIINVDGELFVPVSVDDNKAAIVTTVESTLSLVEYAAKAAE